MNNAIFKKKENFSPDFSSLKKLIMLRTLLERRNLESRNSRPASLTVTQSEENFTGSDFDSDVSTNMPFLEIIERELDRELNIDVNEEEDSSDFDSSDDAEMADVEMAGEDAPANFLNRTDPVFAPFLPREPSLRQRRAFREFERFVNSPGVRTPSERRNAPNPFHIPLSESEIANEPNFFKKIWQTLTEFFECFMEIIFYR